MPNYQPNLFSGFKLNDGLDIKLHKWLGLDALSLVWPTVIEVVVSFNSGLQWGISQEYSFFVSSKCHRFDFVFSLRCISGSHYANRTFYVFFFVSRIISGPRVKFVQ